MPKKVYVVSGGSYSDYHIEGIFSSGAKAKEFVVRESERDAYFRGEVNDIEPFVLNAPLVHWETIVVQMSKAGELIKIENEYGGLPPGFLHFHYENADKAYLKDAGAALDIVWRVATDNDLHAVKVVNEKRAQILALDIWGDEHKVEEIIK